MQLDKPHAQQFRDFISGLIAMVRMFLMQLFDNLGEPARDSRVEFPDRGSQVVADLPHNGEALHLRASP